MSYAFSFTAATKDEAFAQAAKELDAVATAQPNHHKDVREALANVYNALHMLRADETHNVRVQCNGWLSWTTDPEQITGVSINTSVSLVPAATQEGA